MNQNYPARSRLDAEPVSRRDFLGLSAMAACAAALFFSIIGMARLPRAAVVPSPSKKFRVKLPEGMAPDVPFLPPNRNVAIFQTAAGVAAISRVCTHLGCIIKYESNQFHCPCHGSMFSAEGTVIKGPAPKALDWYAVSRADDGSFLIDEGKTVTKGTWIPV